MALPAWRNLHYSLKERAVVRVGRLLSLHVPLENVLFRCDTIVPGHNNKTAANASLLSQKQRRQSPDQQDTSGTIPTLKSVSWKVCHIARM